MGVGEWCFREEILQQENERKSDLLKNVSNAEELCTRPGCSEGMSDTKASLCKSPMVRRVTES